MHIILIIGHKLALSEIASMYDCDMKTNLVMNKISN